MKPLDRAAARRAHDALVSAVHTYQSAEKNVVLRFATVMERQYYRAFDCASIWQYGMERLGFSKAKTAQFIRLARDMERLPALKAAVKSEELTWTQAREVGKVASPQSQATWIETARKSSRRELERQVKAARQRSRSARVQPQLMPAPVSPPADAPQRVTFQLTALQYAQLQKLLQKLERSWRRDRGELLLEAMAALLATQPKECTRVHSPATQTVVYRCDTCAEVRVPTEGGMLRLRPAEARAATCDTTRLRANEPNRATIPPKLRQSVLARDRHRCTRCGRTWFLDVHHRRPRSRGGAHTVENCVTLCRACHVNHHARDPATHAGSGP